MDARLEKIEAWLKLKRWELTRGVNQGLEGLGHDEGTHLADLEELAADVNAEQAIFESFRASSESLLQIDRALERIEKGSYFHCDSCQEPIPDARLEALPWATLCVTCKDLDENPATGMTS